MLGRPRLPDSIDLSVQKRRESARRYLARKRLLKVGITVIPSELEKHLRGRIRLPDTPSRVASRRSYNRKKLILRLASETNLPTDRIGRMLRLEAELEAMLKESDSQ